MDSSVGGSVSSLQPLVVYRRAILFSHTELIAAHNDLGDPCGMIHKPNPLCLILRGSRQIDLDVVRVNKGEFPAHHPSIAVVTLAGAIAPELHCLIAAVGSPFPKSCRFDLWRAP